MTIFYVSIFSFSGIFPPTSVERKTAQFGEVWVYWQVLRTFSNGSVSELSPGQEFTNVVGFVTFTNGLSSQVIRLTAVKDGIAELDESFELRLINATGKFKYHNNCYRSYSYFSFNYMVYRTVLLCPQ